MTRRLLTVAVIVTALSTAQGSLLYAATALPPPSALAAADTEVHAAAGAAPLLLADAATDIAGLACQRGAQPCFGYGSWNCCVEMAFLGGVAGAVTSFLAAGIAAGYLMAYC